MNHVYDTRCLKVNISKEKGFTWTRYNYNYFLQLFCMFYNDTLKKEASEACFLLKVLKVGKFFFLFHPSLTTDNILYHKNSSIVSQRGSCVVIYGIIFIQRWAQPWGPVLFYHHPRWWINWSTLKYYYTYVYCTYIN